MSFELGINITFGSDAHSVEQVGFKYGEAISLAKQIGYQNCISFENRDKKLIHL